MSWPDTVRKASRPKKSWAKSIVPWGVRGRLARSSVETSEQRTGPFRVGGRDDRGVDPDESVLIEEAMDRLGQRMPHAGGCADHIGARAQVRDLTQELERVWLGLDGIGLRVVHPTDGFDGIRLHFERLALGGRRHNGPGRLDGAAGREFEHFIGVIGQRVRRHDLDRVEARAVGNVHEGNARLRVAPGSHPALYRHG